MRISRIARALLVLQVSGFATFASADTPAPDTADATCPSDLKAEVLHNLRKRPRAPKPGKNASTVLVSYRNDYGAPADALLIGIDGEPVLLKCKAPEGHGPVFLGLLAPGVHHVDSVFNFGPGRVGRTPHVLKVKKNEDVWLTAVIDRGDHERPAGDFEEKRVPRPASK